MKILLTPEDITVLKSLRLSDKWDWPATFSCNQRREVWPGKVFGPTPPHERYHVGGLFPSLEVIVCLVLQCRPEGGRFHVDDEGVTLARDGRQIIEFAEPEPSGDAPLQE